MDYAVTLRGNLGGFSRMPTRKDVEKITKRITATLDKEFGSRFDVEVEWSSTDEIEGGD
jgi:hypothetical protein